MSKIGGVSVGAVIMLGCISIWRDI